MKLHDKPAPHLLSKPRAVLGAERTNSTVFRCDCSRANFRYLSNTFGWLTHVKNLLVIGITMPFLWLKNNTLWNHQADFDSETGIAQTWSTRHEPCPNKWCLSFPVEPDKWFHVKPRVQMLLRLQVWLMIHAELWCFHLSQKWLSRWTGGIDKPKGFFRVHNRGQNTHGLEKSWIPNPPLASGAQSPNSFGMGFP